MISIGLSLMRNGERQTHVISCIYVAIRRNDTDCAYLVLIFVVGKFPQFYSCPDLAVVETSVSQEFVPSSKRHIRDTFIRKPDFLIGFLNQHKMLEIDQIWRKKIRYQLSYPIVLGPYLALYGPYNKRYTKRL